MSKRTVRANARATPKATSHPDAAILALAEQCIAAGLVRDDTAEAVDKAQERCHDLTTPPFLLRSERDRQLGLYVGNRVGTAYDYEDIPVLRALVRTNSVIRDRMAPECVETWDRASKLVRALLDLKKEEDREGFTSSLTDAVRRHYLAADVYDDLAEKLLKMTASTVDGALAKARVLISDGLAEEGIDQNLWRHLLDLGPDGDAFTISIARDLVHLAGAEPRT